MNDSLTFFLVTAVVVVAVSAYCIGADFPRGYPQDRPPAAGARLRSADVHSAPDERPLRRSPGADRPPGRPALQSSRLLGGHVQHHYASKSAVFRP